YKIDGEMKMCYNGFHFCQNLIDVNTYYNLNISEFKLFEIEAIGKIKTDGDKSVTSEIKIVREIPKSEILETAIEVVNGCYKFVGHSTTRWFNNSLEYHNNNSPAYELYYSNGQLSSETYYIDGKCHNDNGP